MRPPGWIAEPWPGYCCAIVRDERGRYLIERRPGDARRVPGRLTCFGGGRERSETPEAALRRELREELGLHDDAIDALDLCWSVRLLGEFKPGRRPGGRDAPGGLIAWFAVARRVWREGDGPPLRTEPGHEAVWMEWHELEPAPLLSSWHLAALRAERAGEREARV
jgi:8-oxo-dGTP pyrophosphatase MutT (NUDIX family)